MCKYICIFYENEVDQLSHLLTLCALSVVAKNWKLRGCLSIGEWLNKLWHVMMIGYYCAERNNEMVKFYVNWENLQNRCRVKGAEPGEHCIQRLIHW